MIRPMLLVMYLEWDIEWENSMAVVIFTVLFGGDNTWWKCCIFI